MYWRKYLYMIVVCRTTRWHPLNILSELSAGCLYAAVLTVAIIVAIYSLLVESWMLHAVSCYVMTLVTQTHAPAASMMQHRTELTQYYGKFLWQSFPINSTLHRSQYITSVILDFKVVNQGKFCKYIRSTHSIKSKHNLLQIAHPKAGNNCRWDPIKLTFLYYMHQHFKFFLNIGLMMAFWGWN